MVPIKQQLANKENYGDIRSIVVIRYIVIHYTANDGDSDEGNANYFKNHIVKASAHYFVDDDSITQSVPDNRVAYSVGRARYANGGGRLYGSVTNQNSISIELCDTVKNGIIRPTDKTINNAIDLVRDLMFKYNIPVENVIRHYDVNGKPCPAYWISDPIWKDEFWNKIVKNKADADALKALAEAFGKNRTFGEETKYMKFEALNNMYLRSEPTRNKHKIKFKDLDPTTQKKCIADENGYAKLMKGKTITRVRRYKESMGNIWYQMSKGYWVPFKTDGKKRLQTYY